VAIGYRLSAIGYRLSAIGYRLSAIGYRLSAIGYRLLAIGYWLFAQRNLPCASPASADVLVLNANVPPGKRASLIFVQENLNLATIEHF
jgi:hypothetical protein